MKSAAEQKRIERSAKRASGLTLKQVWVRDAVWPRIQKYIERIMRSKP